MTFKRIDWKTAAQYLTEKSLDKDGPIISEMVDAGEAAAWQVGDAALVGRFDSSEFVLMCLEGKTDWGALRDFFAGVKKAGARSIRIHVKNPAVARLANISMLGLCKFEQTEMVFKADI